VKISIKNILKITLGLIVLGTGYWMFDQYQNEQLWGHVPLVFLASFWAFIVLLFEKKYTNAGKSWRWLGLSTLSGVVLSLGFPPIPLTFLMFLGFVPLLFVEKEISEDKEGTDKWQVFKYAYHTFVVWNILTTWWVANTAFFASFIAIWLNSAFMTIPFLLFHQTKKVSPKLGIWTLPVFWMAFEMLHLNWEISWTWLNLGNAFAEFPSWIQWYEYTGTFGGTLWIWIANLLIFKYLINNNWRFDKWKIPVIYGKDLLKFKLVILLPIAFSIFQYVTYEEQGRGVEVGIVQPNYEPHYEKFKASSQDRQRQFLKLSQQIVTDSTKYLVFPETSFSSVDVDNLNGNRDLRVLRKFVENYPELNIVTGISSYNIFLGDEPHSDATRKMERGDETIYYEALNAATQVSKTDEDYPFYIKSKLVPGAEITPYKSFFFFIQPLMEHLDGSVEGHGTQPNREAFVSPAGKIAPVICYESIYGDYHRGYINAGAEAIFILTNDGWWDNSAGHLQHLKFASLRAIETRRAVVRSANTGISAFLNQRGDILQATKYEEEAAISRTILFNDEITFYVKYGDLIGRISALVTFLLLLNIIVKSKFGSALKQ
jgi:apolipoprotein N-acyltransferase